MFNAFGNISQQLSFGVNIQKLPQCPSNILQSQFPDLRRSLGKKSLHSTRDGPFIGWRQGVRLELRKKLRVARQRPAKRPAKLQFSQELRGAHDSKGIAAANVSPF